MKPALDVGIVVNVKLTARGHLKLKVAAICLWAACGLANLSIRLVNSIGGDVKVDLKP